MGGLNFSDSCQRVDALLYAHLVRGERCEEVLPTSASRILYNNWLS